MKLWIGSSPGAVQVSAPTGQSNCGSASLRGVGDVVARRAAAVVEGVLEHQPVADLVGQGVALGVLAGGAAGHRLVEHDHAVDVVAAVVVALGEVGPAEQAAADVRDVDVEGRGVALVERLLHVALVLARHDGVPGRVDRPGRLA